MKIDKELMNKCRADANMAIGMSSDGIIHDKQKKVDTMAMELYRKRKVVLTVPSIYEQNGCRRRLGPLALRLHEDLQGLSAYDYDLGNGKFQDYCIRRGVPYQVPASALIQTPILFAYKAKLQDAWELFIGHVDEIAEKPAEQIKKPNYDTRKREFISRVLVRI